MSTPVTDANAAAAQLYYNLRPDINFGGAVESRKSARLHRPIVATRHDARSESRFHVEVTCTAAISDNNSLPLTQTASNLIYNTLEHIVPMNIQSRVREEQGKCVASKVGKPQERCSANSPGLRIDIISRELWRCNVEVDPSGFLEHIEQLIQAVMCGTHRNVARSSKRQEKLKRLANRFIHLPDVERTEFQAWVNGITHKHQPIARSATKSGSASDTWKQAHSPGFTAYQPKCTKHTSISAALLKEIEKPLVSNQKDGFIYVFWDKEHFGKVKIGRTNNLERRLKEWDRDCKRTHMYHPISQSGELSKIPHVNRIERLVHIELKECRKQRYCPSCKKNHQEWFDVGEASVAKVILKWQDWIMQRPYALDSKTQTWVLKPEVMKTLAQVCEPVVLVEKQLPLHHASGKKGQRGSKRRTL